MQARESLEECETLFLRHPGTLAYLKDDAEKAKRLVNGGTFYSFVTTEEKGEVYEAMARQFSGTGHWYYCQNNHPVRLSQFMTFRKFGPKVLTTIEITVHSRRLWNANGRNSLSAMR